MKPMYLSRSQFEELSNELKYYKSEQRPKAIEAIATAREHGDLRENAEYAAAKENQGLIERKIARLEEMLSRARIIEEDQMNSDRVHVGRKVKLVDTDTNEEIIYELIPSAEFSNFNPDAVSVDSPVGKALVGKTIDDVVQIQVPAGSLTYKITEIL
jgi:transcription elongation factor GreA